MGKILFRIAVLLYVIALIAYYFHALDLNPQFDTQGVRYSLELLSARDQGQLWNWLTQVPPRKYPLLYILPFSLIESFFWTTNQGMQMIDVHAITRMITLLYAFGTFWVLSRITLRLFGDRRIGILLLMTSTNFFLFSTAVRPHVGVAFWMLLTFLLSLKLREEPLSSRRALFAFGSAACAFATLQSGLFAFIFPVWAMVSENFSWSSARKAACWAAGFGFLGLAFGYPFVFTMFSGSSGADALTAGLDHDVGIFLLPQLIPIKFWEMFSCDLILVIAAAVGIHRSWHAKENILPVLVTVSVFFLVFGMQPITSPRFFIPILPLLTVLASPALLGREKLQAGIAILCILLYGKLAYLALQPNTYQQASSFVNTHDGYLLTHTPSYFLNVPDEKYAQEGQTADRFFYLLKDDEHIPEVEALPLCATFIATSFTTNHLISRYLFFWQEVQWPLLYAAVTRSLGINLRMYCSSPL